MSSKLPEKYFGLLKRIKGEVKPLTIVGFDTEDDTKGNVASTAFYDGNGFFYTTDPDEAITYILEYPETAVFVAHVLEYDIGNVFKYCDFIYIEDMKKAGKLLHVSLKMSKNYFINSNSFYMGQLEKMGKMVGIKKLDGDVLNPLYVKTDARIVYEWMTRFQKKVNQEWGVNLGFTIGQLAMNVFRKQYMDKKGIVTFNSPNCLKAYYGGRVEMFYKGILDEPVHVADINSCYPKVMRDFIYPDSESMEKSTIDTHKYGIGKFDIYIPPKTFIPPLPYKSVNGRLFFPTGTIKGQWWTYAEVRRALSFPGVKIISEYEGEGTHIGVSPFKQFITDFYRKRKVCKDVLEKNPNDVHNLFESELLKLLMNNLYGKFSQWRSRDIMSRTRWSERKMEKEHAVEENIIGPFWSYTIEKESPPFTANYIWGIHVTSYARMYLLDQLLKIHEAGNRLIYCDTDSVMYTGDKHILDYGTELGQLERDTYDLGIFRQAKGYLLCNKMPNVECQFANRKSQIANVKSANGKSQIANRKSQIANRKSQIGNRHSQIEYVIEKVACKGVPTHHALDFITKGMVKFLKPFRIKEALISTGNIEYEDKDGKILQDIGVNVWHRVTKKMRSIYIKRKGNQGVTLPVNVTRIPVLESNAYSDKSLSIEKELSELKINLKNKSKRVDFFSNIVIPPGWHKKTGLPKKAEAFFASQKLHWLKREECAELQPEEIWFCGTVLLIDESQYGEYLKIRLKEYQGQILVSQNMLAALPVQYIPGFEEIKEEILNKDIAITLQDNYFFDKPLKLTVEIIG